MKSEKVCATLYYIASLCFYISAIIHFVNSGSSSKVVVDICLGSTMLCLGIVWSKRYKKSGENKQDENQNRTI